MNEPDIIGPNTCWECGGDYGEHSSNCNVTIKRKVPRRFRTRCDGKHPAGSNHPYRYGVYFPLTDLVVGDMGGRGTGCPENVEWIDSET